MLMGKSQQKFRQNPRKAWYAQVDEVTTNGDFEASFKLKRSQPSLLALLASGYTPVYPCHVSPAEMRTHPIGTGPFKFVEFKANESIKLTRNENYWKKGLPYLDGIEFTIIPNRSTAILAFIAGKFDMTFPTEVTIPLLKDVKTQSPNAVCVIAPTNVSTNIIVNSSNPPFDNADIRRALALALDRKAIISIMFEGQADIGGTMEPAPDGLWAMPKELLEQIPGYGPDINANREEAKKLMQNAGYGPDKHLAVKVSTRNIPIYRDPAVILIDQIKSIYIDGELDVVDTAQWFPKVARKDYALGLNLTGTPSTIPTSHSTKTIPAAPSATTPTIATRRSKNCSTSSRRRRTSRSARNWSGRSTRSCRRTSPAPSSSTAARAPAGSPMSRASPSWRTALLTAIVTRTCG
jgi:peptide/nickel transport system substrate-binding protein